MSRYRILKIDYYDPVIIGKKKRRLYALFALTSVIMAGFYQAFIQLLHMHYLIILGTFPLVIAFAFYLNSRIKNDLKKISTIGEIEFTRSHIIKRLGDVYFEYDFGLIKEMELRKHIPGISPEDNKSGYFSFILKIIYKDSTTESLVVSDRPVDKNRDLSIVDTMKTLRKIIQPEITIIL